MNSQDMQKMLNELRKTIPQKIAQDVVSVQPFNEHVDWDALSAHPLWHSFCNRHFRPENNAEDSTK